MKFLMRGESSSQFGWSHLRRGRAGSGDGDASNMVMGTWSDPSRGGRFPSLLRKEGAGCWQKQG